MSRVLTPEEQNNQFLALEMWRDYPDKSFQWRLQMIEDNFAIQPDEMIEILQRNSTLQEQKKAKGEGNE